MKSIAAFALGLGLLMYLGTPARTQDKKDEKKVEAKGDAPKLEGKYTLVGGKKNDKPIDEDAKKIEYAFTSDQITIKAKEYSFLISYKLDAKATPMEIDMVIVDGPAGSKDSRAAGIIAVKGDTLKLAYSMDKDKDEKIKRPKNFDGKEGFMFEFKKAK